MEREWKGRRREKKGGEGKNEIAGDMTATKIRL